MSRSTLTFWLIAELLVAPAALANDALARCFDDCATAGKQFEKACKSQSPSGKCDGKSKGTVDDLSKRCKKACEKRAEKRADKQQGGH